MSSITQDNNGLSSEPETEGFDFQAGRIWIYPTNYPLRDYQHNIIQQALLKNTLVSLPTGLGKTFIAAVVMYNFYRWYPHGKIIFMAPTRPLVKQQVDACYDIMGIPKEVTAEMTGTKVSTSRTDIWTDKRVFFVTPQLLQNDLDNIKDLGLKVKCVVFDEAHKARGNHAYCEVIRKLQKQNKYFRVLALSATPGGKLNDVVEVAHNLMISRLEFRTEESPDVQPYVFQRNIETVVVPLGAKLQEVKDKYLQILEYYTKVLVKYKVIHGNCSTLTKGRIFMTMKDYQQKARGAGNSNYSEIMKSLNICITLYHAFELLVRHGLRSFLSFFEEHIDKPLLRGNANLVRIMEDVKAYLGPAPNVEQLPDGSYTEIPINTKFGHPKFYKLRDILINHFTQTNDSSRVIVFFEYRESVMEAYALLLQARPLIKPRIFLGQGYGVTQRVQINVIKAFREGDCNALLSTCIGEEGLDVGEVDLIVCFDISNTSPIRMIQRMGRTGRKKEGNIFILVTEGKEQDTLKNCLIQKQNLVNHVLTSKELNNSLQKTSPRMVPEGIVPRCEKMFITVKKTVLSKNSSIKDMLRSISSSSSEPVFSQDLEMREFENKLPKSEMIWNKENPLSLDIRPSVIYTRHIEKQRVLQPTNKIKHSKTTEMFVNLLKFADSKRYNIPMTQVPGDSLLSQNKNMKQGDIRNMFFKQPKELDTDVNEVIKLAQSQTSSECKDYVQAISNEIFEEISSYLLIKQSGRSKCRLCPDNFDCGKFQLSSEDINLTNWIQPDFSLIEKITAEDLDYFAESLSPKSKKLHEILNSEEHQQISPEKFDDIQLGESFFNVDMSIVEVDDKVDKSFSYVAPKSLNNILNRYSTSVVSQRDDDKEIQRNNKDSLAVDVTVIENEENVNLDEILAFFKLTSLEEIFVGESDHDSSTQTTIIYSPTSPVLKRFGSSQRDKSLNSSHSSINSSVSPVLSFNGRSKLQSIKAKKQLNKSFSDEQAKPNLAKLRNYPSCSDASNSKFSSTPVLNKTSKSIKDVSLSRINENELNELGIEDFCNISDFDLTKDVLTQNSGKASSNKVGQSCINDLSEIDDICDLSMFGISCDKPEEDCANRSIQISGNESSRGSDKSQNKTIDIDDLCDLSVFGLADKHSPSTSPILSLASQNKCPIVQYSTVDHDKEMKTSQFNHTSNKQSPVLSLASQNRISNEQYETIDLTSDKNCEIKKLSQLSITQMLSLVAKDDVPNKKSSQKENIPDLTALDDFDEDFSFSLVSSLRPTSLKSKLSTKKTCSPKPSSQRKISTFKDFISQEKSYKTPERKALSETRAENMNESLVISSDDEFQPKMISPNCVKPKETRLFKRQNERSPRKRSDKTRKKKGSDFVYKEAELSDDENVFVSGDEEDDSDQDCYDMSFIADTQEVINNTQVHANYLRSIRSPARPGQFKIPARPRHNITNVFSQIVDDGDDTYVNDSFCVNTEDIECPQNELSELEILELKLKEKRKNKKRKSSEGNKVNNKRRRIVQYLSDDSD